MVEPAAPEGFRAPVKKDVREREREVPLRRARVESDAETWCVGVSRGYLQAPHLRLRWFDRLSGRPGRHRAISAPCAGKSDAQRVFYRTEKIDYIYKFMTKYSVCPRFKSTCFFYSYCRQKNFRPYVRQKNVTPPKTPPVRKSRPPWGSTR